jgi:hypothetical protein
MRPRILRTTLLVALLAAVFCSVLGCLASASSRASATSSPSPAPSPAQTILPGSHAVSPAVARWAVHWFRQAERNREHVLRLRRCLGERGRYGLLPLPLTPLAGDDAWRAWGRDCRRLARQFERDRRHDLRLILHPRLVSAASWRPLILYCGWPRCEAGNVVRCIRAESGGCPRACNGPCRGLMQLHSCWWHGRWHFDPFDPWQNVRHGLLLWRLCGGPRGGWNQWTTMRGVS